MSFSYRDKKFVFRAVVFALVLMSVLFAVQPFLDPQAPAILDESKIIVTVESAQVAQMLKRTDGKPTMLVIYASWCPYCKQLMPHIAEMIRAHEFDKLAAVFVSIDERNYTLAAYLVHNNYAGLFTPYIKAPNTSLSKVLSPLGSRFTGGIPYIGFFDAQGHTIAELIGVTGEDKLKAAIKEVSASNR